MNTVSCPNNLFSQPGIQNLKKGLGSDFTVEYGSMLHIPLTNLLLLAAKQDPYKKADLLMRNIEEFSGKSSREWTSRQKKR